MYKEVLSYCQSHNVELIVVSKMRSLDEVKAIYDLGHRKFAENRVQDLVLRYSELPKDIAWHLIGTLQTNKVKYISPFITLIHSVDDSDLWKEIHRQAIKQKRPIPCLIQIKIAQEATKNGFEWSELISYLNSSDWKAYHQAPIQGVMGMATFTDDIAQVRAEFAQLKKNFEWLKQNYFPSPEFNTISMGMSGDYKLAIEEGSTMVRVGSLIFDAPEKKG